MDQRPAGLVVLSAFFAVGAVIAGTTCVALLRPNSALKAIWALNPEAQAGFQVMGPLAIILMITVAIACGFSAVGLWARKRWGHRVAVMLLAVNLVGDLGNAVVRGDLRTLVGLPIGGAMIAYLLAPQVRRQFSKAAG